MHRFLLWDAPTRLFHWTLAAAVTGAIATGYAGGNWIEWHGRLGLLILGLLAFRLAWGVIGAPSARFANFVRGPSSIAAYLRGQWTGAGHNPLGALAVLALLGFTLLQAGTGLFTTGEISFQGPWAEAVGENASHLAGALHQTVQKLLTGLALVHLLAIGFYAIVKRKNLVRPMVVGWDEGPAPSPDFAADARPLRLRLIAFAAAVLIGAAAILGAQSGAWRGAKPAKPPAAAGASVPAW